jgi:hypothetical protein
MGILRSLPLPPHLAAPPARRPLIPPLLADILSLDPNAEPVHLPRALWGSPSAPTVRISAIQPVVPVSAAPALQPPPSATPATEPVSAEAPEPAEGLPPTHLPRVGDAPSPTRVDPGAPAPAQSANTDLPGDPAAPAAATSSPRPDVLGRSMLVLLTVGALLLGTHLLMTTPPVVPRPGAALTAATEVPAPTPAGDAVPSGDPPAAGKAQP